MGYDMTIIGAVEHAPQTEVDEAEVAYKAAEERVKESGLANVWSDPTTPTQKAALDEYWAADQARSRLRSPEYFRLNIWGMSRYRSVMWELGMVVDSEDVPSDEWPEYNEARAETDENYDDHYQALCRPVLEAHRSDKPGIPIHKFGSNDGWVVTPDEIDAALAAYDQVDRSALHGEAKELLDEAYWQRWIDYLKRARDAEGFRVY